MAIRHRVCGWEGGHIRQWSSGSASAITGVTATAGAARTGSYGLRIAPSASTVNIQGTQYAPIATGFMVGRAYFNFDTLPSADCVFMRWNSGTTRYQLLYRASDGAVRMEHDTNGVQNEVQTGPTISADTWYRLDFRFTGQSETADQSMEWQIDGVEQTMLGPNNAYLGGITFWTLGCVANATFTLFVDDVTAVDNTDSTGTVAEDNEVYNSYPLGPTDGIKALKPTGVGTHNTESAFGTSSGTIADSWQLLDQDPMGGLTDYIFQSTLDTNAYLEYTHADLASDEDPQYVQLYAGVYNNSGIATSDMDIHVIDGASDVHYLNNQAGGAVNIVHNLSGLLRPWTRTQVNALKTRIGYSSDVTPNPRTASVFFEVDFAQSTGSDHWGWAEDTSGDSWDLF